MKNEDCEHTQSNVESAANDPPIIELPPLVAGEHRLGIQISIGGAVKAKIEEDASAVLRERGEAFLQEIVLEGKSITTLDQPKLLDPKVRSGDITMAFDRIVNRYAQRVGRTSRFWRFLHEVPVLLSAVGLTKATEGVIELSKGAMDTSRASTVVVDMTVACVAFVVALVLFVGLSQRE